MNVWVGTSGYNYPEWKGSFYPETLPAAKMLPYYAERFPTVEINYTFYRAPDREDPRRLERGDARALQADAQGAEADHARRAAPRLRRSRAAVPRNGGRAGAEAGRAAVPAAAQSQEGSGAVRRLSRHVSAAGVRGLRVPPCIVVRRRGVRAAARPRAGAVRRRQREAVGAGRDHGAVCYFRLRDEGYTPDDIDALGRRGERPAPHAARTCSSTSSTKRQGKVRSSGRRSWRGLASNASPASASLGQYSIGRLGRRDVPPRPQT